MADLSGRPSTFMTAEARARRDCGVIVRGVFGHPDAPLASYPDVLAVARRVPPSMT
jgi:hypothetical protein